MSQYEHKSINAHCLSEVIKAGREGWKAYQINGGIMYLNREIEQPITLTKKDSDIGFKRHDNLNTKPTCFVCKQCYIHCHVKINHPNASKPNKCIYNYGDYIKWEREED